jgi:hypothetical protein
MSFWNWRRGTQAGATSGSSALALAAPELAPIELYTADSRIVGWIATNGERVTDLLTEREELRVWRPIPGPVDGSTPPAEAASPGDEETGEWRSLPTASMLLAMPPEWRPSRQLRLHKRLRRVAIHIGPFVVTGNLHMLPTQEAGPFILHRHRFLPLTDAHLLHEDEPSFEHVVSVLIVNTAHVAALVPLVNLA